MRAPVPGRSTTVYEELQGMADNGDEQAYRLLYEGPEVPRELEYLFDWFKKLERGRTVGMNGLDGFTWEMIDAWARRARVNPEPHEIDALFFLDRVSRSPDAKLPDLTELDDDLTEE